MNYIVVINVLRLQSYYIFIKNHQNKAEKWLNSLSFRKLSVLLQPKRQGIIT